MMKIKLITIGRTDERYLKDGIDKYVSRLKHYADFQTKEIPDVKLGKKQNISVQKELEGREILKCLAKSDFVVLLDEQGKTYSSRTYSQFIQKRMNAGLNVVFVIGGPFGSSDEVYSRSNQKIALSEMTFSHQMVRLFFVEQLYRSFSILKGEKYHHD